VRVWRLVRRQRLTDAFTGEGSRLLGGRWNSRGVRVVYTSSSLALAQLEFLVRATIHHPPTDVVSISATIPDDVAIESIQRQGLPKDWRQFEPPIEALQLIGDRWVASGSSAVLRVPSAVVPSEDNYLLNPRHHDFVRVAIDKEMDVALDVRLFR
jgi:RES domain-containing protein